MTDNKLTDEQVIKVVDICLSIDEDCADCPLSKCGDCDRIARECFHDLINRKNRAIEYLQLCYEKSEETCSKIMEHNAELLTEIERLQKENKTIRYCYQQAKSYNNSLAESCEKNCKKFNMITRAEARKEYAEKLKKKATYYRCRDGIKYAVSISDIDNLLKEMDGDTE